MIHFLLKYHKCLEAWRNEIEIYPWFVELEKNTLVDYLIKDYDCNSFVLTYGLTIQ